jgi:pyridinium-3,5-biscarboxylic acid mononucleotide synthase
MNAEQLEGLLQRVRRGEIEVADALHNLRDLPFEDLGFARVDHHRALRQGVGEVIFGQGKTPAQVADIFTALRSHGQPVLATRVNGEQADVVQRRHPDAEYHSLARCLTWSDGPVKVTGRGPVLVVTAGTSDLPVAEEAAVSARHLGNEVTVVSDVGVAGIHRLLDAREQLASAAVLIVVAGMEGALASVVGGLVQQPVIAVPTSVGYGASLGGLAALLSMLNSCASGVTVVNIDNGFGAAAAAARINRVPAGQEPPR